MIAVTDLKKGMAIELDGKLYSIIDFQHIKMGRGSAQVRLKMRDIQAGHIIERTFQAGEKLDQVQLRNKQCSVPLPRQQFPLLHGYQEL